jgi:two-component system, response regulator YesN
VCITPSYFSNLFKKEKGVSYVEYLTGVRIEKAKKLLCEKDLKIHEVSNMVGYEDSNYFSRVFKKIVGISPVEYKTKFPK